MAGVLDQRQQFGDLSGRRRWAWLLTEGHAAVWPTGRTSGVGGAVDPEVYAVVEAPKRRRGGTPELLAWRRGRSWVDVRSTDINAYIKEVTGGDFSAKDFRTWNATVLAGVALAVSTGAASTTGRKRAVARAMQESPEDRAGPRPDHVG